MSSYTIDHKINIVGDTRQRKQLGSSNIAILLGVLNKTIIPLALIGYEIVIANSAPRRLSTISNPTCARGIIKTVIPLVLVG